MAADESYDAFSKLLFDFSPEGWLPQLGLPPHPVRVENTDVTRPVMENGATISGWPPECSPACG